jgi:succinate dehydrogenase / fumarate reductase cytochrome b subunit
MSQDQENTMPRQRPLSPHLQVYKPQITSVTSILHRVTGTSLAFGLFFVAWGLIALASGEAAYETFSSFCASILGRILLIGWSFAFFYHLCSGLRHLIMDTGALMTLEAAQKAAYCIYGGAVILTVLLWSLYFSGFHMGDWGHAMSDGEAAVNAVVQSAAPDAQMPDMTESLSGVESLVIEVQDAIQEPAPIEGNTQ